MINLTTNRFLRQVTSKKLTPAGINSHEEEFLLRRLGLTNWIKIYFDFTYYLGVCPFRLVRDIGTGYYHVKVWRMQQVLCAVMHILCIFLLISQIRESMQDFERLHKNPTPYFHIVLCICSLFYKLVTMRGFWLRKDLYLRVVNFTLEEKFLPVRNKWVTKSYLIYSLFGFSTLQILASLIIGYNFVIPMREWSPSWWLRRLVAHARFVLCFEQRMDNKAAPELNEITVLDGFLAFLTAFAQISRWAMGEFCDHIIFASSATMWTTASSFSQDIEDMIRIDEEWDKQAQNGDLPQVIKVRGNKDHQQSSHLNQKQPWSLIYGNFQAIQNLSQEINLALGSQVTWYMSEGLMYYSFNLNTVLLTVDEYKRFYEIVFFILTFLILWVSADICSKLESAKLWLIKNNNIKTVPSDEANLVLLEMTVKDIGIRGSNIYTITFPLVAGFLSLIATFFIICVQLSDVD